MSTATKWRELNEDEKPGRGMEIRIPGDKQPLGVVIKVGPSGITYRPHGGGALQLISASAEVEVRATAEDSTENEKPKAKKQTEEAETSTKPKTKKSKAASVKPETEPKQLEIEEGDEEEPEGENEEEQEEDENEGGNDSDEDGDSDDEKEEPNVKPSTTGWMRIEQLVEKSGVPLGRILKARREGSFEGMTKPDPDYDGVGRKPLIYSPAALKIATSLSGSGGKGGRPPGKKNAAAASTTTSTTTKAAKSGSHYSQESRVSSAPPPPKRHINIERPAAKPKSTAPAQSHLYAAGESLQSTLEGIDAEIARLNELKTRLEEAWSFFAV